MHSDRYASSAPLLCHYCYRMGILAFMSTQYLFQFCQKIVVFSADKRFVLFARRKGEADYDEYWSFIGGKMEVTDEGLLEGVKREKDEEVGESFRIKVLPTLSCHNVLYRKKDGSSMILPHYIAIHTGGEVSLNSDEYSDWRWVAIDDIEQLGPKVDNTGYVVQRALSLMPQLDEDEFVEV